MPDIWCTSQEFLDLGGGDYEEHAILLCNYFNYIDHTIKKTPNISSFIAIGKGVPEGKTTYVIRREKRDGHILVEIWNPVTAKLYYIEQEPFVSKFLCFTTNRGFKNVNNVSDTICLLKSIGTVVSSDNIYINIQPSSDPTLMSYDFENPLFWTSFVNSDVTNKYLKEKPLTNAPVINDQIKEEDPFVGVNELEGAMEAYIVRQFEEIRNRKEGLRRAMRTKWARKVKNSLKNSLAEAIIQLEEYKQKVRNGSQYSKLQTDKFTEINNMQIRETLYQSLDEGVDMFGFPINTCVSNKEHIWQMIKNTSKFLIRYVSISR
jgi:coiled-coil and C2 domain-containing protein 2A